MKARRGDFQAMIGTMDRESLMALALSQYDELSELKAREDASRKIDTEAFIQYSDLEERYRKLLDEHKQLQEQMAALTARDTLNTRTIYVRPAFSWSASSGSGSHSSEALFRRSRIFSVFRP